MNSTKMMSPQESEQTLLEYKRAIQEGDYNEILRFNQKLYESDFVCYKFLLTYKRLWEKKKPDIVAELGESAYLTEIEKTDRGLGKILKNLENLTEASQYIGNLLFISGGQTQ